MSKDLSYFEYQSSKYFKQYWVQSTEHSLYGQHDVTKTFLRASEKPLSPTLGTLINETDNSWSGAKWTYVYNLDPFVISEESEHGHKVKHN